MSLAGSRNPEYGMNKSNENRRVGWNQFPGLEGIARGSEFILKPSVGYQEDSGARWLIFQSIPLAAQGRMDCGNRGKTENRETSEGALAVAQG